ncbi:BMP family ABC transporter substrate-binding protein [Pararhizobium mangrovi]|uniref:BMP family ABC transporter substrate-binding protein n=1 Tax=Pararhizobium mangrovi TaxID=2590452 RepID=A0A506U2J4_9HYPH|nr:BMP family ABC transporter substrate-binding protein [Pararhizobium mangrovi]TPW26789.1 BMP family ABC transporter substrate-binding protein [Pararhizobium mangrovi]
MKKLLLALTASLGMIAAAQAQDKDPTLACFVYVGSHNDGGYSEGHDKARLFLQKEMGDEVKTKYVENVSEGPDATRVLQQLARSGCNIIFATSFGFMDSVVKVAKQFPDVKFEHATGYKTADNLATYNARFYEGRYILGKIAAKKSKTGTAGYIVSFPIPEVVRGIDSFMLGAQSVNPDFKIKIVWVNTWFDPGKEADAAKALFDQGVDIIVQHTDSPAPLQIAEKRGKFGFGQASDMSKFAPDAQLTAIVDHWGPYYVQRVKALRDGTWKSQSSWEGLKDKILIMAPYENMSADTKKMAEETEQKIKDGFDPFTGPITKQDGSVWLKKGETAKDETLLGLNFYVKGVDDKLPQ